MKNPGIRTIIATMNMLMNAASELLSLPLKKAFTIIRCIGRNMRASTVARTIGVRNGRKINRARTAPASSSAPKK